MIVVGETDCVDTSRKIGVTEYETAENPGAGCFLPGV
jgi:hypothetical protein